MVAGSSAVASAFALVVRTRRAGRAERQKIKWLAYGGAVVVGAVFVSGGTAALWGDAAGIAVIAVALLGLPISTGIAIVGYRLYDIDLLINRSLVYGALTAMLAAVYVGGVIFSQSLFRALTGGESQLAIVASTLANAALFNPLRRRVQAFVDRRFYRRKYDAAKALGAFNARLRDETDLVTLSDALVGVVRETMQPAHASVWLRPGTTSRGPQAD